MRTWTSNVGSTIEAELRTFSAGKVTLITESGKEIELALSALSDQDQAFIQEEELKAKEEARKNAGTEIIGIAAVPGQISQAIQCDGSEWSYHAYLPKGFHMAQKWPVCFVMSAGGGRSGNLLKRYIKAAERFGVILIGSVESKNGFQKSQAAVEAMAKDVYKRFPVEEKFALASGMSGGSRMSYLLSECNENVVGVLACGSGSGVYPDNEAYRESKLRPGTYVYSLVGTNCFNRTGTFKSHKAFGDHCRLRFFPGKHVWANDDLIEEGVARILGELILKNKKLVTYEEEYLMALAQLVSDLEEETPWESHYLAAFGAQINDSDVAKRLGSIAERLSSNDKVKLASEAEKDIHQLCAAFYEEYNYFNGDTEELPARSKMAKSLSQKYAGSPYENILSLLGDKSPGAKKK